MAKKAKSTKKKVNSKKITKPTKPTKKTQKSQPRVTVEAEQPTVQAQTAPVVEVVTPVPPPQPEPTPLPQPEPIPEPPPPATPQPQTLVLTSHKRLAGTKVLAQIGRYIVHPARNIADELTITDSDTGRAVTNVHQNVPLPVITWICDCAEAIQNNPRMDAVVKGHGMTNVKATCESVTGLALSMYQAPPPKVQMQ